MSYGDPFAGSAGHFNSVSSNPQYYSTQPCAQQYSSSSEGSPDLSDSSQNSLPRGYQDNRYAYTTQAFPASISPLPMANYGAPVAAYPYDNLAIPQASCHSGLPISPLNEQDTQHAARYDFGVNSTLEPLLQANYQPPANEPGMGGNSDIILNYWVQNGPVLGTNTRMEGPFIPQDSSDAQLFYPADTSSNPNPWLGGSQIEGMASANTTHPSPMARPQSPLDANDEVASPQSVDMEAPQTEDTNGQQNTRNGLPLELVDYWLQPKLLPQAASGMGSRGGKESWTCTYPECDHPPYTRQDQARGHVAVHLGVKPFLCEHCQKAFVRRADCKRHMKKSCKSPQSGATAGLRPLAPTPGNSPGVISSISAGSPPQSFSDGGAKKYGSGNKQLKGSYSNATGTKAPSKSSHRVQVSGPKKVRKGSKSPPSAWGSPMTYPDDM